MEAREAALKTVTRPGTGGLSESQAKAPVKDTRAEASDGASGRGKPSICLATATCGPERKKERQKTSLPPSCCTHAYHMHVVLAQKSGRA